MKYDISKKLNIKFEDAVDLVIKELQLQGFGILSDIDVQSKMKEKLDKDMKPYRILGACHPPSAYEVIQEEALIGLFLPCNVLLRQVEDGVEVSAIDPEAMMGILGNPRIDAVAKDVREKLVQVIEKI